ncbi:MAG: DNA polymerase sliding clamp [Candidatus Thermoplasmatota archaeon]
MRLSLKADRLKEIIDIVSAIVEETRAVIDEEEFRIEAVDESNVAMVVLSVQSNGFEEYEVEEENELGLKLEKIRDFLRIVDKEEMIVLTEEDGRLKAESGNLTQTIPLLDTEGMSIPDIPDLDLSSEVKMKADFLQTGVKAANSISEHLKVKADDMKVQFLAEGDQDEIDMTLYADQFATYSVEKEIESMFAIDYLRDMVKPISANVPVFVRLGPDYPIEIKYNFAEGNGEATMMLAPRIEGG